MAYNRRHGTDGALFRGRYHSLVVDSDNYLLTASQYIHLNPVRAGLASSADDYAWSSFRAFIGLAPTPPWLDVDTVLGHFGGADRHISYERFVQSAPNADGRSILAAYRQGKSSGVLGNAEFRQSAQRAAAAK